jgi:mannose-6-phosphate isomerase-like protein (cupin superfamily)/DNA-binding XRE family transcriptional regulator
VGRHKSKPADTGVDALGDRVRQLRKARGLTLKDLGAAAGLSHGFLSQVERDQAHPSLSTLDDIAAALGIDPAALVSHTSSGFARHVRADDAPTFSFGPGCAVVMRALTGRNALMKMTESIGCFPRSELMAHPGEEVAYVVEGQVAIEVGGKTFLLGPGDVLSFDCSVEHTYETVGDTPPRLLVIAVDPGQYASPVDESIYEYRLARSSVVHQRPEPESPGGAGRAPAPVGAGTVSRPS